jgi:hypothetical protein
VAGSWLLLSTGLSLYTLATIGQTAPVIYGPTATNRFANRDDIEMQPLSTGFYGSWAYAILSACPASLYRPSGRESRNAPKKVQISDKKTTHDGQGKALLPTLSAWAESAAEVVPMRLF